MPSRPPFATANSTSKRSAAQIEFQIAAGTHCIVPVGTTGESPTLSHEEHERVIAAAVEIAAGRVKVMPGTGSNSTREALRLTQWAARQGADAALFVAPYYNKPTQEGFYQHFKAVAEAVEHSDLRLQHPRPNRQEYRAGNDRPDGRAAEYRDGQGSDRLDGPGVADHRPHQSHGLQRRRQHDAADARGRRGAWSRSSATSCPATCSRCWRPSTRATLAEARRWHAKLFPLCRDMLGLSTNPIPIKAAMKLLGRDTGELRLPMTPLDAAGEAKLRKTLSGYGLM